MTDPQPTSGILGMSGDHVPLPPIATPSVPGETGLQKAEHVAESAVKGAGHWIGAHQLFSIGFVVGLVIGGMLGYLVGAV